MAFIINKDNKTVQVSKDCTTCQHIAVCKFHSQMKTLCSTNEFYGMNKYLESNNSLKAFEEHTSCQYYTYKYVIPENKNITLECDPEIIAAVLRDTRRSYGQDWIKNDIAGFDAIEEETGKKIVIQRKVSEVLKEESEYKFI